MLELRPTTELRAKLSYLCLLACLFASSYHLQIPLRPVPLPQCVVPPVLSIESESSPIPDFSAIIDVGLKKQMFFDFLQPYIEEQNDRVIIQRERLLTLTEKIRNGIRLNRTEGFFIRELSRKYELENDTDDYTNLNFIQRLLRRVDVLPASLVLAQAANESAWGTSRFALEGNNFFGQWCYSQGCGLVPSRRRVSARHEVKVFNSVDEAVNAYFMNLNTFPNYHSLRLIRESLRETAQPIDGISLAKGLSTYSERGDEYIDELQSMIHYNSLLERDRPFTQELTD